jgi:hypothetical protein
MSRARAIVVATGAAMIVVGATPSCASPPDTSAVTQLGPTVIDGQPDVPPFDQFQGPDNVGPNQAGVSRFLERRCGSLDCHGQVGRPLRIYGQRGLRFIDDAGNIPGLDPTTPTEVRENYKAVISIEPEEMARVFLQEDDPGSLLLLKKPMTLERHKGGQVISINDSGYICLVSWLAAKTDYGKCGDAISGY